MFHSCGLVAAKNQSLKLLYVRRMTHCDFDRVREHTDVYNKVNFIICLENVFILMHCSWLK